MTPLERLRWAALRGGSVDRKCAATISVSDPVVASQLAVDSDCAEETEHIRFAPGEPVAISPRLAGALRLPSRTQLAGDLERIGVARPSRPCVFVDIETSGTFGSTMQAAMVGAMRYVADGCLELCQWTLCRRTAERSLLLAVGRYVGDDAILLTFNGASFDLPVLRSRSVRTAAPGKLWREATHFDGLHLARRLWSHRLSDCRLSTLERQILGCTRSGDIGGAQAAEILELFLSEPSDRELGRLVDRVRHHNRIDLLTMPALVHAMATALRSPDTPAAAVGAARHLVRTERAEAALDLLEPIVATVFTHGLGHPQEFEVLRLAAELWRNARNWQRSLDIWTWVWQRFPEQSWAAEALAKDLEHRQRRPDRALAVVSASSSPCPRRLDRLTRKVSSQARSLGER